MAFERKPKSRRRPEDDVRRRVDDIEGVLFDQLETDSRLQSGVPADHRVMDLDFIQMTGLTRPLPADQIPEAAGRASDGVESNDILSFFERGVADVDASMAPPSLDEGDEGVDVVRTNTEELAARWENRFGARDDRKPPRDRDSAKDYSAQETDYAPTVLKPSAIIDLKGVLAELEEGVGTDVAPGPSDAAPGDVAEAAATAPSEPVSPIADLREELTDVVDMGAPESAEDTVAVRDFGADIVEPPISFRPEWLVTSDEEGIAESAKEQEYVETFADEVADGQASPGEMLSELSELEEIGAADDALAPVELSTEYLAEIARYVDTLESVSEEMLTVSREPASESIADPDRLEAERLEAERLEAERLEAERLEAERLEAERLEAERLEAERLEAERLEAERVEAERLEAERLEAERLEAERLEAERVEAERLEAERVEAERVEAERLEAERLEAERLEAERLEAERLEAERLEAERLEAERLEAERLEAERLEAERLEAERLEAERLEAEQAESHIESQETAEPTESGETEEESVLAESTEAVVTDNGTTGLEVFSRQDWLDVAELAAETVRPSAEETVAESAKPDDLIEVETGADETEVAAMPVSAEIASPAETASPAKLSSEDLVEILECADAFDSMKHEWETREDEEDIFAASESTAQSSYPESIAPVEPDETASLAAVSAGDTMDAVVSSDEGSLDAGESVSALESLAEGLDESFASSSIEESKFDEDESVVFAPASSASPFAAVESSSEITETPAVAEPIVAPMVSGEKTDASPAGPLPLTLAEAEKLIEELDNQPREILVSTAGAAHDDESAVGGTVTRRSAQESLPLQAHGTSDSVYREPIPQRTRRRSRRSRSRLRRRVIRWMIRGSFAVIILIGLLAGYERIQQWQATPEEAFLGAEKLARASQYVEASNMYAGFAAAHPDHPSRAEAEFQAGYCLQLAPATSFDEEQAQLARALAYYEQFVQDNPAHAKVARATVLMGQLNYRLRRFEKAIDLLRNPSLRLMDPDSALPVLRTLARAYTELGDYASAESALLQAASLSGNYSADVDYDGLGDLFKLRADRAQTPEERTQFERSAIEQWANACQVPGIDPANRAKIQAKRDAMAAQIGEQKQAPGPVGKPIEATPDQASQAAMPPGIVAAEKPAAGPAPGQGMAAEPPQTNDEATEKATRAPDPNIEAQFLDGSVKPSGSSGAQTGSVGQ